MAGIIILTFGTVFESLLGPSLWGWFFILLGSCVLFWNEKSVYWKSAYLFPILILAVVSFISYFVPFSNVETITQTSRLWSGIVICVVYLNWAQKIENQVLILLGLVAIGLGMAMLSPFIVQWAASKGSILPDIVYNWLPAPVVEDTVHPNTIASIMILLFSIPTAFALLIAKNMNRQKFLIIILAVAAAGVMILPLLLSKSRAGLLAGGFSIVFLLWFCHYRKLAIAITLILVTGSLFALYTVVQIDGQASNNVVDSGAFLFRLRVWEISVMMLKDFPFTGVGFGLFNETAAQMYPAFLGMSENPGAHNLFFQIGADLGLIGLIAMMSIYILALYMGRESIRIFATREEIIPWAMSAGLTTGLIAILLHGITDINVWGTRGTFAPWMVMGLIGGIYASTRLANE